MSKNIFATEGAVVLSMSIDGFAGVVQENFGEEVRRQGGQGDGNSMMDLVFDEATGEFRQVRKGSAPEQGTIVTGMTKEGFAC